MFVRLTVRSTLNTLLASVPEYWAAFFEQLARRVGDPRTEEGKALYPYVRSAFESLLEGVEAVHRHALDKPLRVQTYVTASIRWLAKRVPHFLHDHPEVVGCACR